jgi:hypothetical protein
LSYINVSKVADRKVTRRYNIILCGSAQQMMRSISLDPLAPLYGRSDELIRIRPLRPEWIPTYFQADPVRSVELYSVWGGVPRYWELQKSFAGVEEAVLYHVLDPDGVLYKEPELLFNDEWRTSLQAYSILALIGSGIYRISEIAARLEKPATHLSRAIQLLVELDYVRREVPYGVTERSSNKSLYKISDPFIALYFTFVVPHKNQLEYGLKDRVWDLVRDRFNRHISGIWEELCRQGTPGLDAGSVAFNPGSRWWGRIAPRKELEIDLAVRSS